MQGFYNTRMVKKLPVGGLKDDRTKFSPLSSKFQIHAHIVPGGFDFGLRAGSGNQLSFRKSELFITHAGGRTDNTPQRQPCIAFHSHPVRYFHGDAAAYRDTNPACHILAGHGGFLAYPDL